MRPWAPIPQDPPGPGKKRVLQRFAQYATSEPQLTLNTRAELDIDAVPDSSSGGQRSVDGGNTFDKVREIATVHDVGVPDPVSWRIVFDGFADTCTESFASLSIANGVPTGVGVTNTLVLTWPDGALKHEQGARADLRPATG
jgi:hypothetical protein